MRCRSFDHSTGRIASARTLLPIIGALVAVALSISGCADSGDGGPARTPLPSATLAPTLTATIAPTATATPAGASPTPTATALPTQISFSFNFHDGAQGWTAAFSDYPAGEEENLELDAGVRALPPELGPGFGFFIQSHNTPDDIFMFLKRRLGPENGIRAGSGYRVMYSIVFGSNAQSDCSGIGGAPGESVYLKAGASDSEPLSSPGDDGYVRMSVDKGDQSTGGAAASVAGNIANGIPCGSADPMYVSLLRTHTHAVTVSAASDATLWLLIGTDSGFEGLTALYFQRVGVTLVPE